MQSKFINYYSCLILRKTNYKYNYNFIIYLFIQLIQLSLGSCPSTVCHDMKIVCFFKSFRSSIEGVGNVWMFREVLSAKVSQNEALKKMMLDRFIVNSTEWAQRIVLSSNSCQRLFNGACPDLSLKIDTCSFLLSWLILSLGFGQGMKLKMFLPFSVSDHSFTRSSSLLVLYFVLQYSYLHWSHVVSSQHYNFIKNICATTEDRTQDLWVPSLRSTDLLRYKKNRDSMLHIMAQSIESRVRSSVVEHMFFMK